MGALKDSIDKLAYLVGQSQHFQEHVAAYTQDGAQSRIHQGFAGADVGQKVELLPRPFALIEIGDYSGERIADCVWDSEGFLTLKFASEMETESAPGASLIKFAEWCYCVLADMQALAGVDDNLNMRKFEQVDTPTWVPPEQGPVTPWCWASWRIRWARF